MIETINPPLHDDVHAWHLPEEDWPPADEGFDPGPGQGLPKHERISDHVPDAQLDSSESHCGAIGWPPHVPREEAALIDLLREAEDLKSTAAAIQARSAVAFEAARRQAEADRSVPSSKRGGGVSAEVGLARRESPHRGSRLLGLARGLVHELPRTLLALTNGALNEWRATLVAEVRRKVIEIDQAAVLRRRAAAGGDRRVTLRPLPDGMVRVTATLGLREGVAIFAALKKAADEAVGTSDATGKPRGRGAIMADTLVERVTGNPPATPSVLT